MQIERIVLYHVDGTRHHELNLKPGELNVISGVSDTGKSAVVEIIDYCLGSSEHGVYKGPELQTIGWYGLALTVGNTKLFIARQAPPRGQRVSDRAMMVLGSNRSPLPGEVRQTTNIDALIDDLGALIGIEENSTDLADEESRPAVRATLRHAVPYLLQRQRVIADPKYLFAGQENTFRAQHIRDTLPFFLGAVDGDALSLRGRLRSKRFQARKVRARLDELLDESNSTRVRAAGLVTDAQMAGLLPSEGLVEDERTLLSQLLNSPVPTTEPPDGGLPSSIPVLQDEQDAVIQQVRELRATRRMLDRRRRLVKEVADETAEQRARLTSLNLIPEASEAEADVCPVCGEQQAAEDADLADLRHELQRLRRQSASSVVVEPQLQAAIDDVDVQLRLALDTHEQLSTAIAGAVQQSNQVTQARGRVQQAVFLRGRIAGFLEEHPVIDLGLQARMNAELDALEAEVAELSTALSADTTRVRTESALAVIGSDMTAMASSLELSYSDRPVIIDPILLTVIARDDDGPVWLSEDIGSGKNWVGYHVVTLLALQKYFVRHRRPVPQFLVLDQPTQAFFPSSQREDPDRRLADLPDQDQEQVLRMFELIRRTVQELEGGLQVLVLDHAQFDETWFGDALGENSWRGGVGLVPADWTHPVGADA